MGGIGAQPAATAAEVSSGVFSRQNDAPGIAPGPAQRRLTAHPPYVVAPSSPLYRYENEVRKVTKPVNERFQPRLTQPEPKFFPLQCPLGPGFQKEKHLARIPNKKGTKLRNFTKNLKLSIKWSS